MQSFRRHGQTSHLEDDEYSGFLPIVEIRLYVVGPVAFTDRHLGAPRD